MDSASSQTHHFHVELSGADVASVTNQQKNDQSVSKVTETTGSGPTPVDHLTRILPRKKIRSGKHSRPSMNLFARDVNAAAYHSANRFLLHGIELAYEKQ